MKKLTRVILGIFAVSVLNLGQIFFPPQLSASPVEGPFTVELIANKDATISECDRNDNFGSSAKLVVINGRTSCSGSMGGGAGDADPREKNKKALVGFDLLNNVPHGSIILSASLDLKTAPILSTQKQISLSVANTEWKEDEVKWSSNVSVSGSAQTLQSPLELGGMSYGVTSSVQDKIDAKKDYGWLIEELRVDDFSEGEISFYSREDSTENAPKLTVEYKIERPLVSVSAPLKDTYNLENAWPGVISGTASSQNKVEVNDAKLAVFDGANYWNSVSQDWSEASPFWIQVAISANGDFSYPYVPSKDGEFTIFAKSINKQGVESDESKTENIIYDMTEPSAPTANPAPGDFSENQSISLLSGGTIYYTTDRTLPSNTKTEYIAPINITQTTTIRAIAYDAAGNKSNEFFGEYSISRTIKPEQGAGKEGGEQFRSTQEALVFGTEITLGAEASEEIEVTAENQPQEVVVKKGEIKGESEVPEESAVNESVNKASWWWLVVLLTAIIMSYIFWKHKREKTIDNNY